MDKVLRVEPIKESIITSNGVRVADSYRVFLQKDGKVLPSIFQTRKELISLQWSIAIKNYFLK